MKRGMLGQGNLTWAEWGVALGYISAQVQFIQPVTTGLGILVTKPLSLFCTFLTCGFVEQPQSKPANLTSQGNTSSVFLWRIKDAVGFSLRYFRIFLPFLREAEPMLSHTCIMCCALCPLLGTALLSLGLHKDAQVVQKTGLHFSQVWTMSKGLKCHTFVNLCSSIGFYSSRFNDMPVYISYR